MLFLWSPPWAELPAVTGVGNSVTPLFFPCLNETKYKAKGKALALERFWCKTRCPKVLWEWGRRERPGSGDSGRAVVAVARGGQISCRHIWMGPGKFRTSLHSEGTNEFPVSVARSAITPQPGLVSRGRNSYPCPLSWGRDVHTGGDGQTPSAVPGLFPLPVHLSALHVWEFCFSLASGSAL